MKSHSYKTRREPLRSSDSWVVSLYKGDDIKFTGTIAELAAKLGVQRRTVRYHLMPSAERRASRAKDQSKVMRIVLVDDGGEEPV